MTQFRILPLILMTTYVAAGCGTSPPTSPMRSGNLLVTPPDLSTGLIIVDASLLLPTGGTVDNFPDDERARLSAAVTLTTWPEASPVAATSTVVASTPQDLMFTFAPVESLAGRWYAIELQLDPHFDYLDVNAPQSRADDGSRLVRSRFFAGSLPLLMATAHADGDSDARSLIGVGAGEPVHLVDGASLQAITEILISDRVVSCDVTEPDTIDRDLHNPGLVWFRCDAQMTGSVEVRVRPGLVSDTGVLLRDMNANTSPAALRWVPSASGEIAPREPSAALLALTSESVRP